MIQTAKPVCVQKLRRVVRTRISRDVADYRPQSAKLLVMKIRRVLIDPRVILTLFAWYALRFLKVWLKFLKVKEYIIFSKRLLSYSWSRLLTYRITCNIVIIFLVDNICDDRCSKSVRDYSSGDVFCEELFDYAWRNTKELFAVQK